MKILIGTLDLKTVKMFIYNQRVHNIFNDGLYCPATTSLDDKDQVKSAINMGYPLTEEGVHRMLWEHEAAHHFICRKMGYPYSQVHRLIAEYGVENLSNEQKAMCEQEETVVGSFQTFWNSFKITEGVEQVGDPFKLSSSFSFLLQHIKWVKI